MKKLIKSEEISKETPLALDWSDWDAAEILSEEIVDRKAGWRDASDYAAYRHITVDRARRYLREKVDKGQMECRPMRNAISERPHDFFRPIKPNKLKYYDSTTS